MAQTTINSTTAAVAGQEISIHEPTFGSNRAQEPQRASSSPIENLPLELVQMILSFLPGPRALRTAVLSCRLFYYSFLGFKESITTQVLLNRIDISVLPEAVMSLEASELRSMNRASAHFYCMIHEITVDHLRQRPTTRRPWSFLEALHLERRHAIVEELSQDFISRSFKAISRRFELYFERPGWKATHNERRRIERALYRYDIFSAMFSRGCGETEGLAHDYGYQEDGFFQYFAPWENEQLMCIHHHVERRALVPSPSVPRRELPKGFWKDPKKARKALFCRLPLGLDYLVRVWDFLMTKEPPPGYHPQVVEQEEGFLCCGLANYRSLSDVEEESHREIKLKDLTPELEELLVEKPFFRDPDSGPMETWRWAYQDHHNYEWVNEEVHVYQISWGYVMWDKARMEDLGVLKDPWLNEFYLWAY